MKLLLNATRAFVIKQLESIHSGIIGYLLGSHRESIAVDFPIGGRALGYAAGVSRAMWWVCVVAALAFTVWVGASWLMAEVSLQCSKVGESGSSFRCDDRIVHVLGVWPLVGLGLLLATPPVVAVVAMRKWVSWFAVASLIVLSIAGLANWTSMWGSLLFAGPLAALGLIATSLQKDSPRPGTPQSDSASVAA